MGISRRSVLGGIGQAATLGALATALPPQLRAAQAVAPAPAPAAAAPAAAPAPAAPAQTYCLVSLYGSENGATFNGDLFRDQHLPLLKNAYGPSAERIELRLAPPPVEGAQQQPLIAAVNIWFKDVQDFIKRNGAASKDITASMASITKAGFIGQVDQVVKTLGDDRLVVPVDTICVSSYFPAKEGSTYDTKYFAETFYPKLAELYGASVYRIELCSGAAGSAGGKAALQNSAHIYVRDDAAYVEAEEKAVELFTEAATHTNIAPRRTLMRLHAAG